MPHRERNLDYWAADAAQKIVKETSQPIVPAKDSSLKTPKKEEVENLATKTLGVVQENGIYAGMLFLWSRTGKADEAIALRIRGALLKLLTDRLGITPTGSEKADADNAAETLVYLNNRVCKELDTLIMVKQLWEQTLIYTRYGAKARAET
jgi:hypothetical protein